jgi:SNF2 family DNA or RNA helicase
MLLLLLQLPRGALLFDEMGLGKTIQAIGAILATQRQQGALLLVLLLP